MAITHTGKGSKRIPADFAVTSKPNFLPENSGTQPTEISVGKMTTVPQMGPGVFPRMNVFSQIGVNPPGTKGDYIFGEYWGFPDLIAEDLGDDTYRLRPNQNAYQDAIDFGDDLAREFWTNSVDGGVTPGLLGNKWMEQNIYKSQHPIGKGSNHCRIKWTVIASDLHVNYDIRAYIKLLDQTFTPITDDISTTRLTVGSGEMGKTIEEPGDEELIAECGFRLSGVNANPADAATWGSITVRFDVVECTDMDNNLLTEAQSTGSDLTNWNWTGGNLVANGSSFTFTCSSDNPSIYVSVPTDEFESYESSWGVIENEGFDTNWSLKQFGSYVIIPIDYTDAAYQTQRYFGGTSTGTKEFYIMDDGGSGVVGKTFTFTDVAIKNVYNPA